MRALLVKTSSLGDLLQSFPAIDYLIKRDIAIDWIVEERFAELAHAHPNIANVITIDSKTWPKGLGSLRGVGPYDLVIDLQGNCKSGLVTWLVKAPAKVGFTMRSCAEWPNVLATNRRYSLGQKGPAATAYLDVVKEHFCDDVPYSYNGTELKVCDPIPKIPDGAFMICKGSRWPSKQLSEETWQKIIDELPGSAVIVTGEQEASGENVFGRLPLGVWQAMMRQVRGVISVDSAALHLCATTRTPSFSVFGPSNPAVYKPEGMHHACYWGSCPYGKVFERRCPILRSCDAPCTKKLEEESLLSTLHSWVSEIIS